MMRVDFYARFAVIRLAGLLLALSLFIGFNTVQAQWSSDPNVNTPVCAAANEQSAQNIAGDGAGGAIITWRDSRNGNFDIYAQRLNSSGITQWTANGVAICTAGNSQERPTIVSDGAGGAIITWQDFRGGADYDIYAQRINASGAVQWTANGVAICTATDQQYYPVTVSDGAGGAIITWEDYRNTTDMDIYAQLINSSGAVQWTANGVAICGAMYSQVLPAMVSDGAGGAIITWEDYRPFAYPLSDIYAQRVSSSGVVQWTANGVLVCGAAWDQYQPVICGEGNGGVIIAWQDLRNEHSAYADIYAQRITLSGNAQWTANGIPICVQPYHQGNQHIVADGGGGAIITWQDGRARPVHPSYIYAQSVDSLGVVQWTANGTAICMADDVPGIPAIITDGVHGAIITWDDMRAGARDVYAQRINPAGALQWGTNGKSISTASNSQTNPVSVSNGSSGAIIAWQDYRTGTNYDIYTQRVNQDGSIGVPVGVEEASGGQIDFVLYGNSPNPFGRNTVISYALPATQHVTLKVFNVLGREVATLVDGVENSGMKTAVFDAGSLPSGIYTYRLSVLPEGAGSEKALVSVKKMLVLK